MSKWLILWLLFGTFTPPSCSVQCTDCDTRLTLARHMCTRRQILFHNLDAELYTFRVVYEDFGPDNFRIF